MQESVTPEPRDAHAVETAPTRQGEPDAPPFFSCPPLAGDTADCVGRRQLADHLVQRILFLEGLPNLQDIGKLLIGESVPELLACDLKLEMAAIPDLRSGIAYCEQVQDYISRELLEDILESEEEHVDWLETNIELIDKIGLQNYLQSQMDVEGSTGE